MPLRGMGYGMKRLIAAIALAGALVGLVSAKEPTLVSQQGRVFAPGEVAIDVGETVFIANDDLVLHHVYVEQKNFKFDSGEQPPGRTVEIAFSKAGVFTALCAIHLKMRLQVTAE